MPIIYSAKAASEFCSSLLPGLIMAMFALAIPTLFFSFAFIGQKCIAVEMCAVGYTLAAVVDLYPQDIAKLSVGLR